MLRAYFDVSGRGTETSDREVVPRGEDTEGLFVAELDDHDDDSDTGPTEAVSVAVETRFEYADAPADAEPVVHALVELTPRGLGLVHGSGGPVSHVILALDVSASMNRPDKFPLLLEALRRMLYDLQDPDSPDVLISVVAFSMGAERLVDGVAARNLDPRDLEATLRASPLLFGRYTDVAGALGRAGRIAYDAHRENRRMPLRIVVLTDGRPQDFEAAAAAMSRVERVPVDVDCLAFGEDADVLTMKRLLCGRRGGTVKHIDAESIEDAFARIAEVAQRIVAKRSLVDVELVGGTVGGEAWRHRPGRHAFGRGAFELGVRFGTDLGTLIRGRTYSLVLQLRLPRTDADETEIGRVVVRIPGEGGARTFEHVLAIPRVPGCDLPDPDADVRAAVDIVSGVDATDVEKVLASLVARREMHAAERRSERLVKLLDKAIETVRRTGSLDALSKAEFAALSAHTRTVLATTKTLPGAR
jgi:Mg-chelatase subunit ChlD